MGKQMDIHIEHEKLIYLHVRLSDIAHAVTYFEATILLHKAQNISSFFRKAISKLKSSLKIWLKCERRRKMSGRRRKERNLEGTEEI